MRDKIVTVILVVLVALFGARSSYGDITLYSIDDEDGMMRSNEDSGEDDKIRIGNGEDDERVFINILSFDTSSLSGQSITQAWVRLTLADENPIWGDDGQIGPGEEGWKNPDDNGPWMDMDEAFSDDTAFQIPDDKDDDTHDLGACTIYDAWGFEDLLGGGDQLWIELNAEALAYISSHDTVQIRIGVNDGAGSGDAVDWSAMDFYDGGQDNDDDNAALVVVPEPATMLLLGLGGLLLRRCR